MIRPDELIVDLFAGGGGASTGIEAALAELEDRVSLASLLRRFEVRIERTEGCWLWTGARNKRENGELSYGTIKLRKRGILAHRLSWLLSHGSLPRDLKVCHECDNPPCVRPSHLFLGTQDENLADMRAKGRAHFNTFPEGASHPNAKIDPDKAAAIRAMRATGASFAKIGAAFGLHASTVHDIVTGKTWRAA